MYTCIFTHIKWVVQDWRNNTADMVLAHCQSRSDP